MILKTLRGFLNFMDHKLIMKTTKFMFPENSCLLYIYWESLAKGNFDKFDESGSNGQTKLPKIKQ